MATRHFQEDDFLSASLLRLRSGQASASVCLLVPQATPSLGLGASGYGMIHSGYRLGLEAVRFDCLHYRMPPGSLAHRRRIIYRSETLRPQVVLIRARKMLALLDHQWEMVFSHKHFARQNFIHGWCLRCWRSPSRASWRDGGWGRLSTMMAWLSVWMSLNGTDTGSIGV